jgi:hypothetical protein
VVSLDERQELDQLRQRVRAARWATSAPMLVVGGAMLVFAGYQGAVDYYFVPAPLYWPLCGLLALLALWGIDRVRRGRTGVGDGRLPYGKAAAVLVAVVIIGNVAWFLPILRMLLWPTTVLPILGLRQRNNRLAIRSGIIGGLMIVGWFVDTLALDGYYQPLIMGGGGLALTLWGLVERARERSIE